MSGRDQPNWTIDDGLQVKLADRVYVSFQRTPRRDEDMPAALTSYGAVPIAAIDRDQESRAVVAVSEDEAIWIGLAAIDETRPSAVRVVVRKPVHIDALTGSAPLPTISDTPQNYVVVPPQYMVAGVYLAENHTQQFVRRSRVTEGSVGDELEMFLHMPVRAVTFPRALPQKAIQHDRPVDDSRSSKANNPSAEQNVIRDPFGLDTWNRSAAVRITVELMSPDAFVNLTGRAYPGPLNDQSIYGGWRLP